LPRSLNTDRRNRLQPPGRALALGCAFVVGIAGLNLVAEAVLRALIGPGWPRANFIVMLLEGYTWALYAVWLVAQTATDDPKNVRFIFLYLLGWVALLCSVVLLSGWLSRYARMDSRAITIVISPGIVLLSIDVYRRRMRGEVLH
jgi:hypothetical protein